jgi:hypothetical protein
VDSTSAISVANIGAHPIPDEALESDIATLAQKGAGKTYLNKGLVERLLDMGRRVVILDPLNIWWGLKVLADGSPGYPVIVIGGPNGDLPLDPARGAELAEYVAGADVRMVIDVSDLRSGDLVRFSTAFFAEIYRLNRDPLWLVLEEADVFAPQNPQPHETTMLHEVDRIVRRGRQRGFRVWTVTQRPQEINKKVLSQTPVMVLMRLMSPQDREAAKHWLLSHASKAEALKIMDELPSLKVGEGYILAPQLDILTRASFPTIRTLDNSATPKAGVERVKVKALAEVNVDALRLALKPPAPPAAPQGGSSFQPASAQDLHNAHKDGYDLGFSEGEARGYKVGRLHGQDLALRLARKASHEALHAFRKEHPETFDHPEGDQEPEWVAPNYGERTVPFKVIKASPGPARVGKVFTVGADGVERLAGHKVSAAVQKIIAFYEAVSPRAVPFLKAAKQAGVGMKSSQFRTYEPELIASGRVEAAANGYRAVQQGGDPSVYLDEVTAQLSPKHAAIFSFIRSAGRPVTKDEIVEAAQVSPTSSTTTAALSLLINEAEVIEKDGESYRLVEAYR